MKVLGFAENTCPNAFLAHSRPSPYRLRELFRLEFFSWGDEILPGIEAVDTHGHTPGHTSFTIHQANESLLVAGDALTHPILSFQRPLWYQPNDTDAETAAQTRSRLLDRLSSERTLMVAYHLPNAGFGRVEQLENHYRFVPQL